MTRLSSLLTLLLLVAAASCFSVGREKTARSPDKRVSRLLSMLRRGEGMTARLANKLSGLEEFLGDLPADLDDTVAEVESLIASIRVGDLDKAEVKAELDAIKKI